MKSVLYGRVSTSKQQVETQETRLRAYAQSQGLAVAGEFLDADTSGSIAIWERPGGAAMRRFLLAHPDVKHIMVLKLDRLGRSAIDLLQTIDFLKQNKIMLHIVDFGGTALSTMGPLGSILLVVLAGMAEFERELIRSRIKDNLEAKRERGELTGTVPYGWDADFTGEKTPKGTPIRVLIDNPAEQGWIRHMHTLRRCGLSYARIARDLNRRAVPSKRAGQTCNAATDEPFTASGRWTPAQVHKILHSRQVTEWLAQETQTQAAA